MVGSLNLSANHQADVARYAPRPTSSDVVPPDWQGGGWQRLPVRRTEIDGDLEEPLSVQWAASSDQIAAALSAAGWQAPARWASRAALRWLLPSTTIEKLPVLPKFDHGQPQELAFEKVLGHNRRLVIRIWPTSYVIGGKSEKQDSLWNGMVTIERLEHPLGLVTLAVTESDPFAPTQLLRQSIESQHLSMKARPMLGLPMLPVW